MKIHPCRRIRICMTICFFFSLDHLHASDFYENHRAAWILNPQNSARLNRLFRWVHPLWRKTKAFHPLPQPMLPRRQPIALLPLRRNACALKTREEASQPPTPQMRAGHNAQAAKQGQEMPLNHHQRCFQNEMVSMLAVPEGLVLWMKAAGTFVWGLGGISMTMFLRHCVTEWISWFTHSVGQVVPFYFDHVLRPPFDSEACGKDKGWHWIQLTMSSSQKMDVKTVLYHQTCPWCYKVLTYYIYIYTVDWNKSSVDRVLIVLRWMFSFSGQDLTKSPFWGGKSDAKAAAAPTSDSNLPPEVRGNWRSTFSTHTHTKGMNNPWHGFDLISCRDCSDTFLCLEW